MRSPLFLSLFVAAAAAFARPAGADAPPTQTPELETRTALAGLRSPFLRERKEAARALAGLLPDAHAAVLEAWRTGDEQLRVELADVLATDGSVEAATLLIEAWRTGPPALAVEARRALVKNTAATRAALDAVRARPPAGHASSAVPGERPAGIVERDLDPIEKLLERDLVEKLFLSRKSKSGGTGVYRGQYDVLLPHREMALEVCYHILVDRAMRLPGAPSAGGYRFLGRVNQVLDIWEIRQMALSALADLARSGDRELILKLDAYLRDLEKREDSKPWLPAPDDRGDPEKDALYNDLLVTLYRIRPTIYGTQFARRLADRERVFQYHSFLALKHEIISMQLRAGLYQDAIEGYQELLAETSSPEASDYYNLACAYALWSLEPGKRDPTSAELRNQALTNLESAVGAQWTDVGWMEQDKDLDPIRDTPRYRAQVERARATIAGDEPPKKPPTSRRHR